MNSEPNHDEALLGRIEHLINYCETLTELAVSPFSITPKVQADETLQTVVLNGMRLHRATESVLIEWNWRLWRLLHQKSTKDAKFDPNHYDAEMETSKAFGRDYLDVVLSKHPEVNSFNPRPTALAAVLLPMLKLVHGHLSAAIRAVEQQKAINWV